jgi:hypothetical protein
MSTKPQKILILGGYGTFGGRLARLLANDETLTLQIAGRSLRKAQLFCDQLPTGAQRTAVRFDRDGDVEGQRREIQPDLLVDATGPFQSYGDDPYRVVKALCPLWLGSPKRGGTYLFRSRSNLRYAVKSGRARSVGSRFRACRPRVAVAQRDCSRSVLAR